MNLKKSKGSQRGFTLVEVIVVAVIVAAMAAVAVPMYLGYVESSRENAASNAAGSAASFCGACRNSGGNVDATALVATGGGQLTCSVGGTSIQIPADIIVTHVAPDMGTPGSIVGMHVQADTSASFNY